MMAEKHQLEDDILTCSICLELFNEPKILPCLHRFCESCLNRHIMESVSTTTDESQGFPCPCCRGFTQAGYPTRSRSEWAAQFKTDFVIKELVSLRSRAPPEIKHLCLTHKEVECDYYCIDCSQILCHQCALESHRRCKQVSTLTEAANDRKIKLRHMIENMMTQLKLAENSEYLDMEIKRVIKYKQDNVAAAITIWEEDVIKRVAHEKEKLLTQLNMKGKILIVALCSEIVNFRKIQNVFEGRLKTALSNLSLPDIEIMSDNSIENITREWEQVDPSRVDEIMNRIIANVCGIQITFQKASPVSEYLGSIVITDALQDTAGVGENFEAEYATRSRSEWAAQFETDFVIKDFVSLRSRASLEIKHLCLTHKEVECDYYCIDCSQILCHQCALESHRRCKQVSTLTEAANDRKIKLRHMIENMMTQLKLAENSEYLDMEIKRVIKYKQDNVAAAITIWEEDVIKRVAHEKEKLLTQLNMKGKILIVALCSEIVNFRKIQNVFEGRLKTALSNLSLPDIEIMSDNSIENITREWEQVDPSRVDEIINRIITKVCAVEITFQKASPVSEYLGSVVITDALKDTVGVGENSTLNASNDDLPTIPKITLNKPYNITVLRTIAILHGGARSIYISGVIVVAPSNSIIFTDVWNSCVGMITSTGETQMSQLTDSPTSITQVSDNLLVVSLLTSKICLIRMCPSLDVLRYKECFQSYYSLATLDSTTLVAASSTCIDIIDIDGQVLKSFTNENNSDIPMKYYARVSVCVTPDKMIIACFQGNKCLLCLSQDGKTKFKYLQPNICGVACDSSGSIFLVSDNSLLTLTYDGMLDKTLISSTDGILSSPTCVCVDNSGLAYILNNDCNEIKVLSLVGPSLCPMPMYVIWEFCHK